jgi:hypothetical protein
MHLVIVIIRKFVTMHGHMNVKYCPGFSVCSFTSNNNYLFWGLPYVRI